MDSTVKTKKRWGWIMLALWAILIIAGIVAKRIYHHPDWMMFFHLPAAVMLVTSFNILSKDIRKKYQDQIRDFSNYRRNKL
jgi:general stress protein CsbA